MGGTIVLAEAVVYGDRDGAGVACGLHVYFGVADKDRVGRRNFKLFENFMDACWIGFFGRETVSAINRRKSNALFLAPSKI